MVGPWPLPHSLSLMSQLLSQHPLTSAACGCAGKEVSLPPLMTNGLVEEELDHAGPGQGILGL